MEGSTRRAFKRLEESLQALHRKVDRWSELIDVVSDGSEPAAELQPELQPTPGPEPEAPAEPEKAPRRRRRRKSEPEGD